MSPRPTRLKTLSEEFESFVASVEHRAEARAHDALLVAMAGKRFAYLEIIETANAAFGRRHTIKTIGRAIGAARQRAKAPRS